MFEAFGESGSPLDDGVTQDPPLDDARMGCRCVGRRLVVYPKGQELAADRGRAMMFKPHARQWSKLCYVGLSQSRTLTITQRSRDDEDSRSQGHKRFMKRTKDGSSIISTKSVKNESPTSTLYILRVLQGRSLIEQGFVS